MPDEKKTRKQLIEEIRQLRRSNAELLAAAPASVVSGQNVTTGQGVHGALDEVVGLTDNENLKASAIISAIGDGVSIQDTSFRVLYQNQAHVDLVGGDKRGSICYLSYAGSPHICDGCPVEAVFKYKESRRIEKSMPNDRGYIEIKASPLFDSSGNIIAGIELVRDISARKRIEKALTESEKRHRMLFENAGDAIFILEASGENMGRIIDANPAAAEIHGYTIDELLKMHITDLDTPETALHAPERMRRILEGEQIQTEVMHYTKNRDIVHMEINACLHETGGHSYVLAFERDISERKRIEAEREKLITELQYALDNIRTLRGLIPICAWCKKIRDDKGYWGKIENYLEKHSHVSFTHGICPECLKKESPEVYQDIEDNAELYDNLISRREQEGERE